MGIYNKFRERISEKQEKNRSETEDLFLEILTGIGEQVQNIRKYLLSSFEQNEMKRGDMLLEIYDMLKRLEEELL